MIETPADYRSFVFYKANKTPVSSPPRRFGYPEFCFLQGKQISSQFTAAAVRVSKVLFFTGQTNFYFFRRYHKGRVFRSRFFKKAKKAFSKRAPLQPLTQFSIKPEVLFIFEKSKNYVYLKHLNAKGFKNLKFLNCKP